MRLRDRLVDSPSSIGQSLRSRRWELLCQAFPDLAEMRVLDLGGTTEYWLRAPIRPALVTVVNLLEPGPGADGIVAVQGDACEPAVGLGNHDLVISNSLIEHVGGPANRERLAQAVRSGAPRYWVQTPYRYFPVEPHWLFPGMQFLPVPARAAVAQYWPLAHTRARDHQDAINSVLWTDLISRSEMCALFPDAQVSFERVAGIPKSLIAIRGAGRE